MKHKSIRLTYKNRLMKYLLLIAFTFFLFSGCSSSSKVVQIQGQYEHNQKTKTYKIRHQYKGKVSPYNFLADLHKGCYEFHDEHDRWPKDKSELIRFMDKAKMDTKQIRQLKRLSFDPYMHQIQIKFEAKAPKYGVLRLPNPRH